MNGFVNPMILHVVWLKYNARSLGISSGRIYYWTPVKQDISLLSLLPLFLWFQTYSNALGLNCVGQSVSTTSVETQRHWADVTSWLGIAKGVCKWSDDPTRGTPQGHQDWNGTGYPPLYALISGALRLDFNQGSFFGGEEQKSEKQYFFPPEKKSILIIGH